MAMKLQRLGFYLTILGCLSFCLGHSDIPADKEPDPPTPNWLGTPALIELQGLPAEQHSVTTEDGYILTIHRIPNPGKPIVLFLHGLMTNSGCFVANLRNNTLSFMLYDRGFDIWFVNFRGTIYSRSHETLSVDSKEFWEYSWTEEGLNDIPTTIEYIAGITGQDKLSFVAHSEGTAAALTTLSLKPEYQNRVNVLVAFSPAVYIKNTECPGVAVFDKLRVLNIMESIGIYHINVLPFKHYVPEFVCAQFPKFCELTLCEMMGWDMSNLNDDRMGIYVDVIDESSTRNLEHGFQIMRTGEFRLYDYGEKENLRRYNSTSPPYFPLQDVKTPMAMYYGGKDKMVVPQDVEQLLIPAMKGQGWAKQPMFYEKWNHCDPVLGFDDSGSVDALGVVVNFNS